MEADRRSPPGGRKHPARGILRCGYILGTAAWVWSAAAVGAGFLRLDDIQGEATDPDHKGWIEVVAWEQTVSNSVSTPVELAGPLAGLATAWRDQIRISSAGTGRARFGEILLAKAADRASPKLALACAQGRHFREARIELVRRAQGNVLMARIDLQNIQVRSLETQGTADDGGLAESLALSFDDIKFTAIELDIRGVPATQHTAHWDLIKGEGDFASSPFSGGGPDPQAVLNRNLLLNPDAEASPGVPDLLTVAAPSGWQTTGAFTVLRYDAAGGPFSVDSRGPEVRGVNFFVGGPDSATSLARQLIDVTAASALIDERQLKAVLQGWLGGAGAEDDSAEVAATFFRADGTPLGQVDIGPVSAHARRSETGLVLEQDQSGVPPGTRTIEVTMRMTRFDGTYNDGAADNLSLTLIEGHGGPSKLPLRVLFLRASQPGQDSKIKCSWPAGLTQIVIEQSESLAEGWTPSEPEVRIEGTERVFEVPVDSAAPFRFWRIRAQ